MMKRIFHAVVLTMSLLMLSACGDSTSNTTPSVNTSATVKIALSGDLAGKAIAGAGFTITLPANLTPAVTNNAVAATVVTPSGTFAGGTQTPPVYNAAAGTIQIVLANNASGGVVTTGEVATITLQLANNAAPTIAQFPLSDITVIDTLGAPIAGISAIVTGVTVQ